MSDSVSQKSTDKTDIKSIRDEVPIAKVDTAYNAEFLAAVEKTALDPRSRRAFALYFIVMVGFMNAVSSGFDGSLMSGINDMPQYQSYFGMTTTGASTGIIFMIYTVGNCVGSFFAGPICDIWGRRGGMWAGACFILLGSAIITAAQNEKYFLAGRFLLGFGIAISTTAAPTWVTELAPPQWRGRLGGLYNSCFFIGSIPATGAMVGTIKINSTWSWRLPLLLQIVPPTIVIICALFCPESPRWLIQKGRHEEAKAILCKYHSNDGEMNAVIELELREFEESIKVKKSDAFWDYRGLFNSRSKRWRMLCLSLMCLNGQLAGNGLITYFLTVLLKNAGVTSSYRRQLYNFANSLLSAFGAFSGAMLTDKIGRRRRLYIGAFVLAVLLAMVAGLSHQFGAADNTNVAGANASIAMILIFGIAYSFTYTPLQALYCAEVMTQDMRAKGMGVHILISNIVGFINTFGNSVGLGKLGWKYYFVFVGWDLIAAASWYLFCVETRGRTLEELEDVFAQPWPARASAKKLKVAVKETGDIEVLSE